MFTVGNLRWTIIEKWWYFPFFRSLISIAMICLQEGVPLLCVFPAIFSYCRRFGHHQQSASLHAQDTLVRFRSRAGSQSTSPRHFSNIWKQAAIFYYCSETLFLLKVKNISQSNINWTSVHNEQLLGHNEDFDGSFPRSSVANGTATPAQAATDIPGTNRGTSAAMRAPMAPGAPMRNMASFKRCCDDFCYILVH